MSARVLCLALVVLALTGCRRVDDAGPMAEPFEGGVVHQASLADQPLATSPDRLKTLESTRGLFRGAEPEATPAPTPAPTPEPTSEPTPEPTPEATAVADDDDSAAGQGAVTVAQGDDDDSAAGTTAAGADAAGTSDEAGVEGAEAVVAEGAEATEQGSETGAEATAGDAEGSDAASATEALAAADPEVAAAIAAAEAAAAAAVEAAEAGEGTLSPEHQAILDREVAAAVDRSFEGIGDGIPGEGGAVDAATAEAPPSDADALEALASLTPDPLSAAAAEAAEKCEPTVPSLLTTPISQLKLVRTWVVEERLRAEVLAPDGAVFEVAPGDRVGADGGKVVELNRRELVVGEIGFSLDGRAAIFTRVLRLP